MVELSNIEWCDHTFNPWEGCQKVACWTGGNGTSFRGCVMPDPTLHGNHDPCPACELRREVQDTAPFTRAEIACNVCKGKGFLPLSEAEIVRRTCDEARLIYWPQFEARIK